MSKVFFVPDGVYYPDSPKIPEHEHTWAVCRFDPISGDEHYFRGPGVGIVWYLCNFAQTDSDGWIGLGHLASELATSTQNIYARLTRLLARGEVETRHVTNSMLQQVQQFRLLPLGRQRQAEYDVKLATDF
jgi:hypothetical protein